MPVTSGVFARIWKFIDHRAAGEDVTRVDLDAALDDFVAPLNQALSVLDAATVAKNAAEAAVVAATSVGAAAGAIAGADAADAAAAISLANAAASASDAADSATAAATTYSTFLSHFDVSQNLHFADNVKAFFGTGDDLFMFHDGTLNRIQAATGNLQVGAAITSIVSVDGTKTSASFDPATAAMLYYNNVKSLETTAVGVTITGVLTVNGVSGAGQLQAIWNAGTDATEATISAAKLKSAVGALTVLTKKYEPDPVSIALNTTYTFTHGLGVIPVLRLYSLVCISAERGWAVGDEIDFGHGTENYNGDDAPAIAVNSTTITVRTPSTQLLNTIGLNGSSRAPLTVAKWNLKVKAYA